MAKAKKKRVGSEKKTLKKRKVVKPITKKKAIKRKSPVKRAAKKKPLKKAAKAKKLKEDVIGIVTHYFPKVRAAVVKLKDSLSAGNVIKFKGHTTDFTQAVSSMQIDHVVVDTAKKGQEIGLLVNSRVRQHDIVYKA